MMDTVDDLHAAEDFAGMAVDTLVQLLAGTSGSSRLARVVIASWETYCRPTCHADDGPHDEVCEEGATCGCPCRSRR